MSVSALFLIVAARVQTSGEADGLFRRPSAVAHPRVPVDHPNATELDKYVWKPDASFSYTGE